MLRLILFACLPGCGLLHAADAPPPPDPHTASVWVTDALEETRALHQSGRAASAIDTWARAHDLFDGRLEPGLRATLDDRKVAALEYRFALAHQALQADPKRADAVLSGLIDEINLAVSTVPEAPVPEAPEP